MDKEILTVKECAVYLSVSERTVQRYITNRLIPATKIGKSWRIPLSGLRELVNFNPA